MPTSDPQKPTRSAPPAPADGTLPPPETLAPDPALYPFLAPPQAGGELGRLGRYRVLGVVGQGGMGVVFRAEDTALRRQVALKVMLPQFAANPLAKARFLREGRAAAAVEHDHILQVFNVDEDRGVPFLAMPLLRGMTLADALKTGHRPPPAEVLRVGREIAEGLAAAHAAGLVHRDIKTANVWLEGSKRRVKILDFGLARHAADDPADGGPHTTSGVAVGTPAFMSPEQANGEPVDARTDLWSLGVILYEMATGRRPFTGPNTLAVIAALATHNPPPPAAVAPDCPPDLSRLVAALLTKDLARRPADAAAVAAELGRIEQEMSVAMAAPVALPDARRDDPWADLTAAGVSETAAPAPAAPPPRKAPAGAVWAASGLAVLLAGAAVAWWLATAGRPTPPTDRDEVADATPPRPNPTKKAASNPPAPKADAPITTERGAAERLLRTQGVRLVGRTVDGGRFEAAGKDPLPPGSFVVTQLHLPNALPADFTAATLLPAVANLTGLEELVVPWDTAMQAPADLEAVARSPSRDTLTRVATKAPLTPALCRTLRRFPNLRHLDAVGGDAAAFGELKTIPHLTGLNLSNVGAGGPPPAADWDALAALPLRTLFLTNAQHVGPAAAAKLAAMPGLEWLRLVGSKPEPGAVAALAKSGSLRTVGFPHTRTPPRDEFPALTALTLLHSLELHSAGVTDDDVPRLAGFTNLRRLNLVDNPVTPAGAARLAEALPLCAVAHGKSEAAAVIEPRPLAPHRISVAALLKAGVGVSVTGAGGRRAVKAAEDLTADDRLTALRVTAAPAALALLRADPPLVWSSVTHRELHLVGPFAAAELRDTLDAAAAVGVNWVSGLDAEIAPDAHGELARIPDLEVAVCRRVSEAALTRLLALPRLFHLGVSGADFPPAAWAKLRGAPLVAISLAENPAVDDAVLDHLAAFPRVREVNLRGTAVTRAGVERLAAALPAGCNVVWADGTLTALPVADRMKAFVRQWLAAGGEVFAGPRSANAAGRTLRTADELTADDLLISLSPPAGPGGPVTPAALDLLRTLPPAARHPGFNLGLAGPVTADDLRALAAVGTLHGLPGLVLRDAGLTDAAAAEFARFPELRFLSATSNPNLTDATLDTLAGLPYLARVQLQGTKVTAAGLSALRDTGLTILTLRDNPGIDDAAVEHLSAIPTLTHVRLQGTKVTADGVKKLRAARPGIRAEWDGDRAADAATHRKVAEWAIRQPGTWSLSVAFPGEPGHSTLVTAAASLPDRPFTVFQVQVRGHPAPAELSLDGLFPLGGLDFVGLADTPLTDDDFRRLFPHLARLGVQTVSLESLAITDDTLAALAEVPSLRIAYIQGNRGVTAAGVLALADHPGLAALYTNQQADDDLVRAVCRKKKWQGLGFHNPKVTAAVLPDLLSNPDLRNLSLGEIKLSDADVLRLAALKELARLEVKKSGASGAAFRKLADALPRCRIVWEEGTIEPRER